MKKLMLIALLGATVGSAWGAAAPSLPINIRNDLSEPITCSGSSDWNATIRPGEEKMINFNRNGAPGQLWLLIGRSTRYYIDNNDGSINPGNRIVLQTAAINSTTGKNLSIKKMGQYYGFGQ